MSSPRPCRKHGCGKPTRNKSGYCDAHEESERKAQPSGSYAARNGFSKAQWDHVRRAHLQVEPLCRTCKSNDKNVSASHVDHIRAHHGDPNLFWDETNLQSLCHSCHSRKTAAHDGGFGNTPHMNGRVEDAP